MSKKNKVTFSRTDKQPINGSRHNWREHFAGRKSGEPIYNAEGCRIECEAVLAHSPIEAYKIYVRVGDLWFEAMEINSGDPAIEELREAGSFEAFGPSPQEIEKQKTKETEENERVAVEQAHKQSRRDHHLRVRQQAEERRLAAIEERSYGW